MVCCNSLYRGCCRAAREKAQVLMFSELALQNGRTQLMGRARLERATSCVSCKPGVQRNHCRSKWLRRMRLFDCSKGCSSFEHGSLAENCFNSCCDLLWLAHRAIPKSDCDFQSYIAASPHLFELSHGAKVRFCCAGSRWSFRRWNTAGSQPSRPLTFDPVEAHACLAF